MFKHWFFDLDGTLARTGEDIIAAWKGALSAMGRDLTRFDEVFRIGPPLEAMAHALYDDVTPEMVAEMLTRFKPLYDDSGFPNTVMYPMIPEVLAAIRAAGGKSYIATNKRHRATMLLARKFGWDRSMDGIWSHDTFGEKMSKPELLAKLLAEKGLPVEQTVMVGDTKGDIDAGKANGLATIGVTWGYGSREELAGADVIVDSAAELLKILASEASKKGTCA